MANVTHAEAFLNPTPQKISTALIITVLGLMSGLTPFAIDMYLPAIPSMASEMGSTTGQVQLSISAYLLTFSIGQLFFGPISDSLGRRGITLFGLALFFIASLAITRAQNPTELSLMRLVQGLGGGAVSVAIMASMRDMFSGDRLAKMTSYLMMIMAISPMVAPITGAQLLRMFHWQSIFFGLALLAVIALILYVSTLSESLAKTQRQPLQLRHVFKAYGLVLGNKTSLVYLAVNGFSSAPMFIFISASPFVYIDYFGVSSQNFSYCFMLNVAFLMFHSWLNTRLLRRWKFQQVLRRAVQLSLLPSAGLLFVSFTLPHEYILWGLLPLIALVIGVTSLISTNAFAGVMTQHPKNAGSAASVAGLTRFGFGALIGALVNIFPTGDHLSMIGAMVASAVAAWLVLRINLASVMGDGH